MNGHKLNRPARKRRKWIGPTLLLAAAASAIFVAAIPWLLANTPLGNAVLRWSLRDSGYEASFERISCGWFSPLQISALKLARPDATLQVRIERIGFQESWLRLWRRSPELGPTRVDRPEIEVVWNPGAPPVADKRPSGNTRWTASAAVRSASLRVRMAEEQVPVVAWEDFDLHLQVVRSGAGRVLSVEPFTVFADEEVTSQLCDRGLQLIAPVLADAMRLEGHATLGISSISIPLDAEDSRQRSGLTSVRGWLRLSRVQAGLKNPLLREIAAVVSTLLQTQLPQTLQIADDSQVDFELREGRVHHQGLVFLLPELSPDLFWRTSGAVGLDRSLDLKVEARLPLTLLHEGPLTRQLSERPIEFHVTGTLDKPKVELFKEQGWMGGVAELIRSATPSAEAASEEESIAGSVLDIVGSALEQLRDARPENETPWLDRLRQRREERKNAAADPDESEEGEEDPPPPRRGLLRRRDRASP